MASKHPRSNLKRAIKRLRKRRPPIKRNSASAGEYEEVELIGPSLDAKDGK